MPREDFRHAINYPHRVTCGKTVYFFRDKPDADVLDAMHNWLARPLKRRLATEPLPHANVALFGKRVSIRNLRKQVRATRGVRKSNGTYDWLVEEMINTAEANQRGAAVPEMVGYGYTRSRLGWVKEQFLVTRLLHGYTDGAQWLRAHPGSVQQLISTLFGVLRDLHGKGISHIDLWAGNVMIPSTPGEPAMAIDLENCFTTPPQYLPELLALQFALPYRCSLYRYITEVDYDQRVHEELARYGNIDLTRFAPLYAQAKHERITNEARRPVFTQGALQ
jgi:hypothetical protein